jgi:hypothetical protein
MFVYPNSLIKYNCGELMVTTDNESDYEKKNVGGRKTKRNKHKKNKTRKK